MGFTSYVPTVGSSPVPLSVANGGSGSTTAAGSPWLPLVGGTMSGAINMGSAQINAIAAGAASTDAPNLLQVPQFPTLAQMGLLAWSYPHTWASGQTAALTSGVVYLIRIPLYGATVSVTNILLGVVTAGGTLTANQCFAGLYDGTGTKIGGTADQHTNWASVGLSTMALTGGPFNITTAFGYVVIVSNGTTNPGFARGPGATIGATFPVLGSTGSNMPWCTNGTGATALPGSLTYSSNAGTNTPQAIWAGLS